MAANPIITKTTTDRDTITLFLKNDGTSALGRGRLLAKQTSKDGTVKDVIIPNDSTLEPGETVKLSKKLIYDPRVLHVIMYEDSESTSFPIDYLTKRNPWGNWEI
jgi:hypothetical protein